MSSRIPENIRQEVLTRDSIDGCPCCIWCGQPSPEGKGLHLHHVKFRSQLGRDEANNLVTLCFKCHMKLHDGDKEIAEYVKGYLKENEECIKTML